MVRVVQSLCDRKLPTVLGDMVMHCYLHHCQLIFYHTMTPIVSIAHVEENEDSDNDHETVESNDRDSDSVNDQKIMVSYQQLKELMEQNVVHKKCIVEEKKD